MFAGENGTSRVFRCTMKQNRKNCAAMYTEEEYEELVLEAYWQAKDKIKQANNRYRFICIHCRESVKDKNTVSYHRMFNLCKSYTGEKPLKMYPTWEPSNHGEKQRIAAKYGKASSPHASHSPSPASFPPALDLGGGSSTALATVPAEQGTASRKRKLPTRTAAPPSAGRTRTTTAEIPPPSPPRKTHNLAVKAATKSPTCSRQQPKSKKPPRRTVIISSEEELSSDTSRSEEEESTSKETTSQNSADGDFRVVKHDRLQPTPPRPREIDLSPLRKVPEPFDGNLIMAGTVHEGIVIDNPTRPNVGFPVHVHEITVDPESPVEEQPSVPPAQRTVLRPRIEALPRGPLTREECEQQAYEEATNIYNAQNVAPPPPATVPVNGLYVLIQETDEQWVPKRLLEDPDACMQYLNKQLDDGTIGPRMCSAFGQWYLYGHPKVCSVFCVL